MNTSSIRQWVQNGPNNDLIAEAEKFGKFLADGQKGALSTSQIRQVFTKLKNIESKGLTENRLGDLLMLKPMVAYAAGRHKKQGIRQLDNLVRAGIDCIVECQGDDMNKRFRHFVKLFEAVLAYHRAHGGN